MGLPSPACAKTTGHPPDAFYDDRDLLGRLVDVPIEQSGLFGRHVRGGADHDPGGADPRDPIEVHGRAEADEVKPVFHRIKAGEMLLREGERISEVQLLKIRALQAEVDTRLLAKKARAAGYVLLQAVTLFRVMPPLPTHAPACIDPECPTP